MSSSTTTSTAHLRQEEPSTHDPKKNNDELELLRSTSTLDERTEIVSSSVSLQEKQERENSKEIIISNNNNNNREAGDEDDFNSIRNFTFDPELSLLLEEHLQLSVPCCWCCESSQHENSQDDVVDDDDDDADTNEDHGDKSSHLKLSPALSFLIYTFLFYGPLVWSSLKPIFFPPKIAQVGNFDGCSWLNETTEEENNNNNNISGVNSSSSVKFPSDTFTLVPFDYIDCVRCNNDKGYVPLQPALTQMTGFALTMILFRVFVAAVIGSWVFCRCYFERVISLRLLAFGVLVAPPPKRQYVPDLALCVAACAGISYQLAYLTTFAPPSLNYVNLGSCPTFNNFNRNNNVDALAPPPFVNKTIIGHFNQSTVDALYRVASAESELFNFLSLLLPFLIGPIFSIFKHQQPLSLMDTTIAFGSKKRMEEFGRKIPKRGGNTNSSTSLVVRHLARVSLWRIPCLMVKRRGWCEFAIDAILASLPIPVNYFRRLILSRSNEKKFLDEKAGEELESGLVNRESNNNDNIVAETATTTTTQTTTQANAIRLFMEYELGRFSSEFVLVSPEKFRSRNYQKWLWCDCVISISFALVVLVGYLSAIQPTLTFEEAKQEQLI